MITQLIVYWIWKIQLNCNSLSKQIGLENPDLKHQIACIGKLEENNGAIMFFIIEKPEETTFTFSQISVCII